MDNNKTILLITSSFDLTADYLITKYSDIEFFRFNLDLFHDYDISVTPDGVTFKNSTRTLLLDKTVSIYFRKPSLPELKGLPKEHILFCHREIYSFIEGIIDSFEGVIMSRPSVLRQANNKILQALIASKAGFVMPKFLISNSQAEVKDKCQASTHIVKPIATGEIRLKDYKEIIQTNILNKDIPLTDLNYCPAYFQEYIDKEFDLRITFVGEHYWPVKIISDNNVDWRVSGSSRSYELVEVPDFIIASCQKMMKELGLNFGCFDFVIKDGIYYFLEVNANGQWAWLEQELKLDISNQIIKRLVTDA